MLEGRLISKFNLVIPDIFLLVLKDKERSSFWSGEKWFDTLYPIDRMNTMSTSKNTNSRGLFLKRTTIDFSEFEMF